MPLTTTAAGRSLIAAPSPRTASARAGTRTRRALVVALVLSLLVHFALSFWPAPLPDGSDAVPLTATLTEMPPPPAPVMAQAAKPKPAARRVAPARVAPVAVPAKTPDPLPAVPDAQDGAGPLAADAAAHEAAASAMAAAPEVIPGATVTAPVLPPRVELAYKVFYGTRGFLIGEAVYRFEHHGNNYQITTVGEARGLAALILRGQGKVQSRGLITAAGLQTLEFDVERGGPDRRESAVFDWEAGIVTMKDNKTAALDLPTFDPMTVMWQFYFTPPAQDVVAFSIATPRRFARYTVTREESEDIEWAQGTLATERWHRRSEDGQTDAYVWLAPKLHYVPVKIRVSNTDRGTVEALLDAIRVDEERTE
jgi:hypothetical protein